MNCYITKNKKRISKTLTQTEAPICHDADATGVLYAVIHPTPLSYPKAIK